MNGLLSFGSLSRKLKSESTGDPTDAKEIWEEMYTTSGEFPRGAEEGLAQFLTHAVLNNWEKTDSAFETNAIAWKDICNALDEAGLDGMNILGKAFFSSTDIWELPAIFDVIVGEEGFYQKLITAMETADGMGKIQDFNEIEKAKAEVDGYVQTIIDKLKQNSKDVTEENIEALKEKYRQQADKTTDFNESIGEGDISDKEQESGDGSTDLDESIGEGDISDKEENSEKEHVGDLNEAGAETIEDPHKKNGDSSVGIGDSIGEGDISDKNEAGAETIEDPHKKNGDSSVGIGDSIGEGNISDKDEAGAETIEDPHKKNGDSSAGLGESIGKENISDEEEKSYKENVGDLNDKNIGSGKLDDNE